MDSVTAAEIAKLDTMTVSKLVERFESLVGEKCRTPALQDILEKCVRELGAIRLIDSRIGVPGQLACNPRVILG